jgi:hypothetical protein
MSDLVNFELAQKLKEKGFKEKCLCYYVGEDLYYNIESPIANNQLWFSHNKFDNIWHRDNYDAPTISQVLKWLREEKKIHIGIGYSPRKKWRYVVMYMDDRFYNRPTLAVDGFLKFELAALAGIDYSLDNLI